MYRCPLGFNTNCTVFSSVAGNAEQGPSILTETPLAPCASVGEYIDRKSICDKGACNVPEGPVCSTSEVCETFRPARYSGEHYGRLKLYSSRPDHSNECNARLQHDCTMSHRFQRVAQGTTLSGGCQVQLFLLKYSSQLGW